MRPSTKRQGGSLSKFCGVLLGCALSAGLAHAGTPGTAAEPVRYAGEELPDQDKHDGGLRPYIGVQNYQLFRANRSDLTQGNGLGWTYNHAPDMAYWNGRYYVEFVCGPVNEDDKPAVGKDHRLLMWSSDGRTWSKPIVSFPYYPMGSTLTQCISRCAFFVSASNRLLMTTSVTKYDVPIGRAVREVNPDNTLGPVYFIRYYSKLGWNATNTNWPNYTTSSDAGFKAACNELLGNKLATENWWEDEVNSQHTDLLPAQWPTDGFYKMNYPDTYCKALSVMRRKDGAMVGFMKYGRTTLSFDNGQTWSTILTPPTIVTNSAKVWGQALEDGSYAMVYNPTTHHGLRYPLAMTTSADGIRYDHMGVITGEVPPMRYGGRYKSVGPQYMRGIAPWCGNPPGSDFWIAWSQNKEDIWVSRVPMPARLTTITAINDNFNAMPAGGVVTDWNIENGVWCPVGVVNVPSASDRSLELQDRDPYEHAKAMRIFPQSTGVNVTFRAMPKQTSQGELHFELNDATGRRPVRILFGGDGQIKAVNGAATVNLMPYSANTWYAFAVNADAKAGNFSVSINGVSRLSAAAFAESASSLERLVFRTGPHRTFPNTSYADQSAIALVPDLPNSNAPVALAVFNIDDVATATDTYKPVLVQAKPDGNRRITLEFSKPIDPVTSIQSANYSLTPSVTISSVEATAHSNRVVLNLGGSLAVSTAYTLTVNNVKDRALAPNTIAAGSSLALSIPTAPVTTGLRLWAKADAGVTSDANGNISAWADQSGAGNHLVQATAGKQPRRIDGALNGKPVVRFDGGDCLARSSSLFPNEYGSVFVVFKAGRPAATERIFDTAADGKNSRHSLFQNADWLALSVNEGNGCRTDAHATNSFVVFTGLYHGHRSYSRLNAFNQRLGGFGTTVMGTWSEKTLPSEAPFVLGARYSQDQAFYNGDIAEILIYDSSLSQANVAQVEQYLMNRYFAAANPAPELDVSRDGSAVNDGSTDTVGSSTAGSALALNYTLTNPGGATLTLTTATLGSAQNCTVAVTSQPNSSVAGGSSTTLALSVTPTAAGAWSVQVSMGSNDAGENPYNWTLAGTASAVSGNLIQSIVNVSTGRNYTLGTARVGQTVFTDRVYQIETLPANLDAQEMIKTFNDDDSVSVANHLVFRLSAAADVYVAYENHAATMPAWANGFVKVDGASIRAQGAGTFNLFVKRYPAGDVTLGGNDRAATGAVSNYFVIALRAANNAQTPYGGTAHAIPGKIEAEHFDEGGAGIAYQDLDDINNGGKFRNTAVDLDTAVDSGGGYLVGWTRDGEWLEYSVNIAASGEYNLTARATSGISGSVLRIECDGIDITGQMSVPNTGGWQAWTTLTKTVQLPSGSHTLRIVVVKGGFNLNWLNFERAFSPGQVTGLKIWLAADAGVTRSSAGNVSRWADQSGNGHDVVQATASRQPVQAENVLNGKPVIRFDGNSDTLAVQAALWAPISTTFTVFKASKLPAPVSQFVLDTGLDNQKSRHQLAVSSGISLGIEHGGAVFNTGYTSGQYIVFSGVIDGTNSRSAINTGAVATGSVSGALQSAAPLVVGGRYTQDAAFYAGDIAEVLIYDGALSPEQIQNINAYLQVKYALQPAQSQVVAASPESMDLIAAGGANSVSLTWSGPGDTGYKLERSSDGQYWELLATLEPGTNAYTDTACLPATTYYYRLLVTNLEESTYSKVATATTFSVDNPGGAKPSILPLTLTKVKGKYALISVGKDTISLAGKLPDLSAGTVFQGKTLRVNIGGAETTFSLDANGKARNPQGNAALKLKKDRKSKAFVGGATPFKIRLSKGTWGALWESSGIRTTGSLLVSIELDGIRYEAAHTLNVKVNTKMVVFK